MDEEQKTDEVKEEEPTDAELDTEETAEEPVSQ